MRCDVAEITEVAQKLVEKAKASVPFYTKEDLQKLLNSLAQAPEGSPSRVSVQEELYRALDDCGIGYERDKSVTYYRVIIAASNVPTLSESYEKLIGRLYEFYLHNASPRKYMTRLVNALADPKDGGRADEPTRLRILRRFIRCDYLGNVKDIRGKSTIGGKNTILTWAKKKSHKAGPLTVEEVLGNIDDTVFKPYEEAVAAAKAAVSAAQGPAAAAKAAVAAAKDAVKKAEEAIPPNMTALEQAQRELSLNTTALEQARREFKIAKDAYKEIKKTSGKFGLLKMADDLAAGRFREGETKRDLYLFAIAFDMTYHTAPNTSLRDIERSLFQDYYTNNLVRFVTRAYQGNSGLEQVPAESGINFKNFAEIIYVYYIAKANMSSTEKLRRVSEMIAKIAIKPDIAIKPGKESDKKKADGKAKRTDKETAVYRMEFDTEMRDLTEEEFEKKLLDYDRCMGRDAVPFSVATERRTAFKLFQECMARVDDALKNPASWDPGWDRPRDWRGFVDKHSGLLLWGHAEQYIEKRKAQLRQEENPEKALKLKNLLEKFRAVLEKMDAFMKDSVLKTENERSVTRTSLLAACYYARIIRREVGLEDDLPAMRFNEFFEDFRNDVNVLMDKAGYARLSYKSLLDVLVVFSAYMQLVGKSVSIR